MTEEATRSLLQRWDTQRGRELASEVFARLQTGAPLEGIGLEEHEGRLDLRGIQAPPVTQHPSRAGKWAMLELSGMMELRGVCLQDVDFSRSQLESARMFNSVIRGCRFDQARCQDWRLWAVDVVDTSFVGSDLRQAVLGPWYKGRGCTYRRVDFSKANLRQIVCPAATFEDCDFADAALSKIDFGSTSFIRCRFRGLLREVTFWDRGFKSQKPDANPMEDVDFSGADLRWVEFRRLDLNRVKFPTDADHLVLHHYRCVLQEALRVLAGDNALPNRKLRIVLENELKWIGPHQERGVFNRCDFVETGGEEQAAFAVELLRRLERECATSGS